MSKRLSIAIVTMISLLCSHAVAETIQWPKIDRRPAAAKWPLLWRLPKVPTYDPNSDKAFQVDLRQRFMASLDLRDSLADLQQATFDDATIWPPAEKMPPGFDPEAILERARNPGLGVRALHAKGITGRGVGIAILDQPLQVDHQEFGDRLRLYEELNIRKDMKAQMHGPAVASIAVGKTVGVAPEADLYFVAQWNGDYEDGEFTYNFEYLARGIDRILEINQQLPEDRKIRVISASIGWTPKRKGYDRITEATERAKAAGLLVICSSVERVHGFKFHGLGRDPQADPDDPNSYEPGYWWAESFYQGDDYVTGGDRLLVPMDSRTTAGPTGTDQYVFYRHGGWSWAIPYIAGMHALAAQVDPTITPDRFWDVAMKTGHTIELQHDGQTHKLGPILNPPGLIEALRAGG